MKNTVILIIAATFLLVSSPVVAGGWQRLTKTASWGEKVEIEISPDLQKRFSAVTWTSNNSFASRVHVNFIVVKELPRGSGLKDLEAAGVILEEYDRHIKCAIYDENGKSHKPNGKNVVQILMPTDPIITPTGFRPVVTGQFVISNHKIRKIKVWWENNG